MGSEVFRNLPLPMGVIVGILFQGVCSSVGLMGTNDELARWMSIDVTIYKLGGGSVRKGLD